MSGIAVASTARGRWALSLLGDKAMLQTMNGVADIVDSEVQRSMANSRGANGQHLPGVARWTRWATGYNPTSRVLNRTGTLRKAHRPKKVTSKQVVYGPTGKMVAVANRLIEGGPSLMAVDPGKIRTAKNGGEYIRIKLNNGQWRTKKVVGGKVRINVQPRDYLGLSGKALKAIDRQFSQGIEAT